jgi:membrane protease YdiL (CAAX protease family)
MVAKTTLMNKTTVISKTTVIKNVTVYSVYLVLVWAFYRFLFRLPDQVEEIIVKPILWLVPIFWLLKKEGAGMSSIGLTFKKLFPAIYLAIGLGAIFVGEALMTNYLKYGGFSFGASLGNTTFTALLGLSFVTAFSEETAFRGYIFGRLLVALKSELSANIVQTLLWTAIHVPIAFFVWGYTLSQGMVYLFLTAAFGMGSAFIFSRTKNIIGSVLLHVLWEWPIILFR